MIRAWPFRLGYRLVPEWFRLLVARVLRGASQRKLARVEPLAFPIDLALSERWLRDLDARELLMGHLHREEAHDHPEGRATRMLPGWGAREGPHFVLGPASRLERFA